MRVAACYDVHGNLPALDVVLAELARIGPDVVLVGGDVVLGPFPAEVLERLRALGDRARFVRGNTEREILDPSSLPGGIWAERTAWVAGRLTPGQLDFLASLAEQEVLEVDGLGPTLFCHGTPRSDEEIVTRLTPDARLQSIVAGVSQRTVVCGHTHVQFDRTVAGVRLVNAGSVGMPYEHEPGARWALLGPDVQLRCTPYDLDAAAGRIRASGFPGADEFARDYLLDPPSPEQASERFERTTQDRA